MATDLDTLTIELPLPDSRNAGLGGHWAVKAKQKKAYYAKADLFALHQRFAFPAERFQFVHASAVVYAWNIHDQDNLMARMKNLQDWCKSRSIVFDDRPPHWVWPAQPTFVVERKLEPHVILTLRRVDAPEGWKPPRPRKPRVKKDEAVKFSAPSRGAQKPYTQRIYRRG